MCSIGAVPEHDTEGRWMKGSKTLVATLVATLLLAAAAPASAGAVAYRHYVACGISEGAKPSHRCPKKSKKGAFFKSLEADVFYSICVKFPTGKSICAKAQKAEAHTLYVNKITSNIPGKHRVTWFVNGKRVGAFVFTVAA
jgi:ABC-type sugar transport system substrate-binding protein